MSESSARKKAFLHQLSLLLPHEHEKPHELEGREEKAFSLMEEYLAACGSTPFDEEEELFMHELCATKWWKVQISFMQRAVRQEFVTPYQWFLLGKAYSGLGRFDDAEAAFDEGLLLDASNFDCLYGKATNHADMQRYDDAIALYRQCLSIEEHEYIHPMIGYCLAHQNRYREAVKEITIGLDYYKANMQKNALIDTTSVLCSIHIQYHRPYKALSCVNSALELAQESSRLHVLKGDIYTFLKKDKKAYRCYYDGIILSRNRLESVKRIGLNLFVQKEYYLSERILYFIIRDLEFGEEHSLLDESPMYQTYSYLYAHWSYCQYKLGHHHQFVHSFEKGLRICPDAMKEVFCSVLPESCDIHNFLEYYYNSEQYIDDRWSFPDE